MEKYVPKGIDEYKSIFDEDISKKSINKAIVNMANLISKKLGKKVNVPEYTMDFSNSNGDQSGIRCIVGDKEAIRFNWKISGSSANVESISFWNKPSPNPHLELDSVKDADGKITPISQLNLIKLIDIIVDVFQKKQTGDYMAEDVPRVSVTPTIKSILAWKNSEYANDSSNWTDDLQNKRVTDLYNKYTFWYNNLSDDQVMEYVYVKLPQFRRYLYSIMKELGIENKFLKKVQVKKASKEILKVSKGSAKKFQDAMYSLNVWDKIEMLKKGVVAVIKGYSNARLFCGKAGIGKSTAVIGQLEAFGADHVVYKGGIKNARAMYQILYDNNKKDRIIVFDDVDSILKKNDVAKLLQAATDSGVVRIVTYHDDAIAKSRRYDTKMDFIARIIIISNTPKKKLKKEITSRTAPVEINVDIEEMAVYIRQNLEEAPPPVPIEWKEDVWNFIYDEIGLESIKDLDFRLFADACLWKASTPDTPEWKKFVYTLLAA